MNKRGRIRSFCDGLVNLLTLTNVYRGEQGIGRFIIDSTMPKQGPVDRPYYFATGYLCGATLEIGFGIFSIYEASKGTPWYLVGDITAKTFFRGLEYAVSKKLDDQKHNT